VFRPEKTLLLIVYGVGLQPITLTIDCIDIAAALDQWGSQGFTDASTTVCGSLGFPGAYL